MQSCNDPFLYSVTLNRARGPGTPFVMLASNSSVSLRYRALVMGVSSGHGAGRWYRLNTCCFLKSTHGDFSGKIKARLGSALDVGHATTRVAVRKHQLLTWIQHVFIVLSHERITQGYRNPGFAERIGVSHRSGSSGCQQLGSAPDQILVRHLVDLSAAQP